MTTSAHAKKISALTAHSSPLADLTYRALVYAKSNAEVPTYFVAGTNGGPWGAVKALQKAHTIHGGNCFYCKKAVAKGEGTVDHIEPVKLGGKDVLQNLVIACKPCNAAKGHTIIDLYNPNAGKEWLEATLAQIQQRLNRINRPS